MSGDQLLSLGVGKMAQWARAWVENETVIPEVSAEGLTDAEKAGLLVVAMVLHAIKATP